MPVISKYYLAAPPIAERTGLIGSRYRVRDGRYVLSYMDMKNIRFTPDELLNGIGQYIEEVGEEEAGRLIAENGYKIGRDEVRVQTEPETPEQQPDRQEAEPESEENNQPTNEEEE
ncbi:MAG: hypothetical protein IJT48_07675 [Bacteroidaceae bacterium]|nr:hypothetical protein [Bacteroidaceae bacterium]